MMQTRHMSLTDPLLQESLRAGGCRGREILPVLSLLIIAGSGLVASVCSTLVSVHIFAKEWPRRQRRLQMMQHIPSPEHVRRTARTPPDESGFTRELFFDEKGQRR
eukprot:gnl/TRDRNA2_/TRDRNA2_167213_c0_seq2.p1 gnl/TRDRNA2_/TRDRNA2_167213_c0~~gnl/TRDRNA2_/TRDRNA2_167213_c0_seq2.p1  ORF type:complete len:106 (+),score=11.19 gnl/TRDRNA2_/TRDRNA2_167213_c0_seq2:223-540(+)